MVLDEKKQEERLQSVKGEGQGKKVARFRITNKHSSVILGIWGNGPLGRKESEG